jgi:acetylglutamate kinase
MASQPPNPVMIRQGNRHIVNTASMAGLAAAGLPARDLAYFAATSLEPEVRARIEHDLVTAYHQALLNHGVTD